MPFVAARQHKWLWCMKHVPLGRWHYAKRGRGRFGAGQEHTAFADEFCETSCAGSNCCEPTGWDGSVLRCMNSWVPKELQVGQGTWWWLLC